jgi:hypothetical protein
MTASEYQALAAETVQSTAHVESVTEQVRLRGQFDYDAPLPDLHIRKARSWEPAARHYRDLTDDEKEG